MLVYTYQLLRVQARLSEVGQQRKAARQRDAKPSAAVDEVATSQHLRVVLPKVCLRSSPACTVCSCYCSIIKSVDSALKDGVDVLSTSTRQGRVCCSDWAASCEASAQHHTNKVALAPMEELVPIEKQD